MLSVVCAAMLTLEVLSPLLLPLLLPSILFPRYCCRAADIPEDTTSEFSVRLYHQLQAVGDQDNIIFSPLSVAVALGMVELGAKGTSLEEIRQAVGFSHLLPGVEFSLLQNLTAALSDDDTNYVIRFANSLFLQEGVTFNPEFLHLMRKYFRADVETVDFSESAAVAEQINSWVENHTESKIRELLSAEDFSSVTRLTLVNAIYFRGSWKNQFRPENTRTFSFSKDDGSEVQTLMMYQQGDFYYGEFSDGSQEAGGVYQVLEMPYEGEDMSMMIVLPRQEVPLASWSPSSRQRCWRNGLTMSNGRRWRSTYLDGKDLFIGKAVQKAYLEVTEEGAEGAVGSGMIALTRTLVLYPQVMADHPFFFVIRNRRTGSIIFMGRVMTPEVIEPNDHDFDSM
uniref:Serpin peptidase inhibitor, clade I (neuroserpin), member 1 n=1 Tax=Labrus bergylta TaxID=56723 RepID=A0A3Q3F3X8_9LABR